jgi:hypothetical protein
MPGYTPPNQSGSVWSSARCGLVICSEGCGRTCTVQCDIEKHDRIPQQYTPHAAAGFLVVAPHQYDSLSYSRMRCVNVCCPCHACQALSSLSSYNICVVHCQCTVPLACAACVMAPLFNSAALQLCATLCQTVSPAGRASKRAHPMKFKNECLTCYIRPALDAHARRLPARFRGCL